MITFLTFTTCGYTDFTKNMLINFEKIGLSIHTIIIMCLDDFSYENLKEYESSYIQLRKWTKFSLAQYADYGTDDFKKIMHQKIVIIKELLQEYDQIYFIDSDIVWFKDPEPLVNATSGDIVFQQDAPWNHHQNLYHPWLCTGNFLVRKNEKSLAFIDKWINMLTPQFSEQETSYNYFKTFGNDVRQVSDISIGVFPMESFQNGYDAFECSWHQKEEKVCIHANHRIGSENKINVLKSIGMWFL